MIKNGYQLCIDITKEGEENTPLLESVCLLTYEAVDDLYRKLRVAYEHNDIGFDFIVIHWVDDKIEETWVL